MDRAEAFRTLRLAKTADSDMVRDADWNVVRKTQSASPVAILASA
jgi:hypothetical protein